MLFVIRLRVKIFIKLITYNNMTDSYPYMLSNNKIEPILGKIRAAAKPLKFTHELLKQMGYSSSNDRAVIPLLKRLGFLSEEGAPTEYYDRLKDNTDWQFVLGERINDLYKDIFNINTEIYKASDEEIKGAISRTTGKDEASVTRYLTTFKTLTNLAKFGTSPRVKENDFSPILIHDAERMATVYALFYCLENAVRELISDRLSERYGTGWWSTTCVSEKIKKSANDLKEKEEKNKYHIPRASSMIGYTMFGNLSQLIVNNWQDFSDFFPDQHWVSSRLNDLELSRNIIMHTGFLPEIEIGRIESISRDWIRQVG